ncbi:MAG TPA: ribosome-associated translation inhibitor RaiA [Methylomusa anaerophila]|uniref:Ribosome hibernation promoting factor n=1 Tax=Methylomusa anaerophila TaxID=1930071 RepID=A0A348AKX4_9FIRM|nr:ribosome-associated translation inhibitor RaiA [Methylomusa anaerophila]BBB91722.1 putative sigma-54 modulation protein [Methylomusa anaerophila]HML88541.1 ribosome-associated translation inhibitor RaiA [Methylomusa anaerophila]
MAITVRGKNIEITSALKDYVAKRVGKITKYFDPASLGDITAILTVEKGRHIVEVTAAVNGLLLRGEEATSDMYASVDLVIEKLEKQIEKYKTKLSRKFRSGGFKADLTPAATLASEAEAFAEAEVVKTKRFAVKPMALDEAIMQMNLIHHDFYVFRNADTEEVNVIYRRRDGNYGLIEPEY